MDKSRLSGQPGSAPGGKEPVFSAAVLAGGRSVRMGGRDKASLEIEGESFLYRTIRRLQPLFREVMIVGHPVEKYAVHGLPVHSDLRPGCGSLGGILTALVHSRSPMTFCVACDMPFLEPTLVGHLLHRADAGSEAVLPRLAPGIEPLCALYSSSLVPRIERLLDSGERRIRPVLEGARTVFVEEKELRAFDPPLRSFFNVNKPEDLEEAMRLAGEGGR